MFYSILGGELYKQLFDGPLARCLGESEASIALAEVHEGISGAHQAAEKMKLVLKRHNVFWPIMTKDGLAFKKTEC